MLIIGKNKFKYIVSDLTHIGKGIYQAKILLKKWLNKKIDTIKIIVKDYEVVFVTPKELKEFRLFKDNQDQWITLSKLKDCLWNKINKELKLKIK